MTYVSKNWKVKEWDCYHRDENEFAWTDEATGNLATDNEQTANLFKILDMLRDWNPSWQINWTVYKEQFGMALKSGYRDVEANAACNGEEDSYHVRGCAADISITDQTDTDSALAETVLAAAEAYGLQDSMGIGFYGDWVHIDTRGYTSRW